MILKLDKYKITKFPENTKLIVFQLYSGHILPKNLINFSPSLEHFILSSYKPIDISILPLNLKILELSEGKFILDNVSENLKILKLDRTFFDVKLNYKLYDFLNLPASIEEIHIGDTIYKGIQDLIENYWKIEIIIIW